MKSLFCVLVVVLICQTLAVKKRYDGYQVLRINLSNSTKYDIDNFIVLTENHLVDVWASNRREGWVDIMVAPDKVGLFTENFDAKVQIENMQTSIDESEAELSSSGPKGIFDYFPTTGQTVAWINEQANAHPDVAEVFRFGSTFYGNDIMGIRLAYDTSRPTLFLHCTIHAREWITTTTCLWIIDSLLNSDSDGPALIQKFQWVIVPILNVDGYDYAHTNDRLWRKSRNSNAGSTCIGTDLNRNYAYGWGGGGSSANPCAETFRGVRAFSAPETESQRAFLQPLMDAGRVAAFVDIHAYGGQWMSPWGYTTDLPPHYNEMYVAMESITDAVYSENGRAYDYGTSARVIYIAAGGSDDWAYGSGGVTLSFTVECWGSSFTAPISAIIPTGSEVWQGMKQLALDL